MSSKFAPKRRERGIPDLSPPSFRAPVPSLEMNPMKSLMHVSPVGLKRSVLALVALSGLRLCALDIPYANKGVDGVFHPTGGQYVVDLSKAVTGRWDDPQSAPLEPGGWGVGIYDPEKWAVVFRFSSVTVPAGTTVTFKNHPSRAPVVWLVDGDVTIQGDVDLDGAPGDRDVDRIVLSEPGPGGFRGGDYSILGVAPVNGLGPGGSYGNPNRGDLGYVGNQGASYGTYGSLGWGANATIPLYGNSRVLPLIGGSGIGGDANNPTAGGGGGGGAILIAAAGSVEIGAAGRIHANGRGAGVGANGGGTGGAIRLICERLVGGGFVEVLGGGYSGHGRIRVEAHETSGMTRFRPFIWAVPPDNPVRIWPDDSAPTVRVLSVDGVAAPADPRAEVVFALSGGTRPADVGLPAASSVNSVTIETLNLPTNAIVELRVVSIPTGGDIRVNATLAAIDPGNPARLTWTKDVVMPPGIHVLQVRAEAP